MPRIRIETGQVSDAGRQMTSAANQLSSIAQRLAGTIQQLQSWQGDSRMRMDASFSSVRPKANALSQQATTLGNRLTQIAMAFERADNETLLCVKDIPWSSPYSSQLPPIPPLPVPVPTPVPAWPYQSVPSPVLRKRDIEQILRGMKEITFSVLISKLGLGLPKWLYEAGEAMGLYKEWVAAVFSYGVNDPRADKALERYVEKLVTLIPNVGDLLKILSASAGPVE